eukprot:TRINITY_DN2355_c0_g1_i1.p2 TRINITY_DN2355_c0_g1~~TRINITY_DN2355_c0_g1_i1.p2  ORF type:complete len:370 (-),score=70.44 TRINITY_DN2355_c0_g1_i1:2472-3581(-)
MGGLVSSTLKSSIVPPSSFSGMEALFSLGMFSCIITSALWLGLATYAKLPVSTTQTIIGAIIGFASLELGFESINMSTILNIGLSWIISPVLGGVISFVLYLYISKIILSGYTLERSCILYPINSGLTFSALISSILLGNRSALGIPIYAIIIAIAGFGLLAGVVSYIFMSKYLLPTLEVDVEDAEGIDNTRIIEEKYKYLMIISSIFVAFAHGSNDVANAIGPLSVIIEYATTGTVSDTTSMPWYVIAGGGIGIVIGLAILGYRVMETIGEKITKLTYTRGYAAQFGAALTVLFATSLGLPISTTSVLVGSVAGTGLVKDTHSEESVGGGVQVKMLLKIVGGWIMTVVIGYSLTVVIYFSLKLIIFKS